MQQAQTFSLSNLTGSDIDAIVTGLGELPAKTSRAVLNKIEQDIVGQLQAAQRAAEAPPKREDN